jgi:Arylsulfotransferase (ASST)
MPYLLLPWFACADDDAARNGVSASAEAAALPLQQRLVVTMDVADGSWATCTSPDDPAELHLAESPEPATEHALLLRGLLPGVAYECTVHAASSPTTASASFVTDVPTELPQLTATTDGATPTSGAYTLFNTQEGCFGGDMWLVIADLDGKVRWFYPLADDYIADIDATLIDADTLHYGGGWGLMSDAAPNRGIFRTIDLSGDVLIERTLPDFGLGFNHHSEPLADGTYLSLTGHLDGDGDRDWHGVGIELWDPDLGVVWSWDSQARYDAGLLETPSESNENLPYHANAVSLHTDALGDAAWVSNYGTEEIWRIDRATAEVTHVFGAGGDFTLTDLAGEPLTDAGFPSVQHGVDYQGDRLLAYDNGQDSGRSRVVEYQVDLQTNEAVLLWEWTEPGWYDPIVGDADYLPNGNVLVTQGFNICLTPFSSSESELVELLPPSTVAWRLTWPDGLWTLYRAQRYDGCDVFANARYCPAVSSRIAELAAASGS